MSIDLKTWVIWTLRKASYRWPPRSKALSSARMTPTKRERDAYPRCRNFYQCNECEQCFPRKGVSIDHIQPVVDPRKGWQGFDEFIRRMFCETSGFQILCNECHNRKTKKENAVRKVHKKRRAA